MIDGSSSEEPVDRYINKLALSLGRSACFFIVQRSAANDPDVLRPLTDTDITIGDRTPSLFLGDLITLYSQIFPPLVDRKKEEKERVMPVRKRTALVDQRISRSRLSSETNPQDLLEAQHALTNPRRPISPIPENKSLPTPASEPAAAQGPSVSALGLGDPSRTEFDEPQSLSGQDTPVEPKPAASVPPLEPPIPVSSTHPNMDPNAPPSFAEPNDSDNEGDLEDAASATMQYLASVDNAPEDQPVTGSTAGSGVSGLKRAGSGEASRLRGPRGEYSHGIFTIVGADL
jgi:hypothetical protein